LNIGAKILAFHCRQHCNFVRTTVFGCVWQFLMWHKQWPTKNLWN